MALPFIKNLDDTLVKELKSRQNNIDTSTLYPWISVTSNLGSQKTLSSTTYKSVIGGKDATYGSTDTGASKYGLRPNPIVTDFSIDFASRGTLRRATIKIKCFTKVQLEEIQQYFLEPGVSVYIQWGWNKSLSEKKRVGPTKLEYETISKFWRSAVDLDAKRKDFNYCYDNMFGIITGGNSSISGEDFDVTVKVSSLGELLMGKSQNIPGEGAIYSTSSYDTSFIAGAIDKIIEADKSVAKNWKSFYNNLPESVRNLSIRKWGGNDDSKGEPQKGSTIPFNFATDFINFDELRISEAISELSTNSFSLAALKIADSIRNPPPDASLARRVGSAIVSGITEAAIEAYGNIAYKNRKILPGEKSPMSDTKYIKFSAFITLLNQMHTRSIRKTTSQNSIKVTGINFNIEIGTGISGDKNNVYISSFANIFSPDERIFIPNRNCYNWYLDTPLWNTGLTKKINGDQPEPPTDLCEGIFSTMDNSVAKSPTIGDNNPENAPGGPISFPKLEEITIDDEDGEYTLVPDTYGWLGDIYIDWNIASNALDRPNDAIKDILDDVLKDMADASQGLWEFQIVEHTDGKAMRLRIVELNLLNKKNDSNVSPPQFYLHGTKSIFLDASFELDIPKAMSSQIVMSKSVTQSDSPENCITEYDQAGMKSLFGRIGGGELKDDILDKIYEEIKEQQQEEGLPDTTTGESAGIESRIQMEWGLLAQSNKVLLNPIFHKSKIDANNADDWIIPGIYLNKNVYSLFRRYAQTNKTQVFNSRPLPVKFMFTVHGISGFKVGNVFNVIGLPEKYSKGGSKENGGTIGAFQVQEITHKVNDTGWTTEVTSMYRPYNP